MTHTSYYRRKYQKIQRLVSHPRRVEQEGEGGVLEPPGWTGVGSLASLAEDVDDLMERPRLQFETWRADATPTC